MSKFGKNLIASMKQAVAHAKGHKGARHARHQACSPHEAKRCAGAAELQTLIPDVAALIRAMLGVNLLDMVYWEGS